MNNLSIPLTMAEMQAIKQPMTAEGVFKMFLVLFTHLLFIYINSVMLLTLRTKAMFRETARYILFGHMLFNDIMLLLNSMILYLMGVLYLMVVRAACAVFVLLSASTFVNAPLNLAVMSLERYMAICFPLRHSELATPVRASSAVSLVWALGLIDVLTDVFALFLLAEPSFYLSPALCTLEQLQLAPWQQLKNVTFNALLLVIVAGVLLYTYVAITRQARAASADPTSAQKALHTVLLHTFQLGLSLMSFLYNQLGFLLASLPLVIYFRLRFFIYFMVLILPRCLSSLIYGLRDETFRPHFKKRFFFSSTKFRHRRVLSKR